MRIVHAALGYPPGTGGADLYLRDIAEYMAQRGHDVTVLVSDLLEHVRFIRLSSDVPRAAVEGGVSVKRLRTFNLPGHVYPIIPGMLSRLVFSGADVLHAHCYNYFPTDAALLSRIVRKRPLILKPWFQRRNDGLILGTYRSAIEYLTRLADCVVVATRFEREEMERAGIRARRFVEIPPSVDPAPWAEAKGGFFEEEFPGRPVILFAGRVCKGKGVDLLIRAAARIKDDLDFVIVLAGPDYGETESLMEEARASGLGGRIKAYGYLDDDRLKRLFASASVLVLPTRYETFGIVLIEAMAAGLPIVATNSSAVPTVVDDGRTGLLVPPDDDEGLARCIKDVLTSRELADRLAEEGRRTVRERFSRESCMRRHEELYHEVARCAV